LNPSSAAVCRGHSRGFAAAWRALLARHFGYCREGEWLRVPSLLGGYALSYLPLLNYTDLSLDEAGPLIRQVEGRSYLLRCLDPGVTCHEGGDPVTMRLVLGGRDEEGVWRECLNAKCRNQVRKAQDSRLRHESGDSPRLVDAFFALYAQTMHRYGAPPLPRSLFQAVAAELEATFRVVWLEGQPLAALVELRDEELRWVPWAGSALDGRALNSNHLLYWEAIREACATGAELFDFGRCAYAGNTFRFKRQWGAQPVAISLMSNRSADPYGRYRLAQKVWARLPRKLCDRLGPWLARRLLDY
jgi:hypothetical protein